MKAIAIVLSVTAALTLAAQTASKQAPPPNAAAPRRPVATCKGPDARPCTSKQVDALSEAAFSQKRYHDALASFKTLALASADGTLKCELNDGTTCTTTQLDEIKELAADRQLYLNYNSSK